MRLSELQDAHGFFVLLRDDLLRGDPERDSIEEAAARHAALLAGLLGKYQDIAERLSILDFQYIYEALRDMRDMQVDIGNREAVDKVDLVWKVANRLEGFARKTRDAVPAR